MKITLPCWIKGGYEDVEAELLDIAPHLAAVATWAVHKGLPTDLFYKDYWFVSNVETGLYAYYDRSREAAIKETVERLANYSPTKMVRHFYKMTRRYSAHATKGDSRG